MVLAGGRWKRGLGEGRGGGEGRGTGRWRLAAPGWGPSTFPSFPSNPQLSVPPRKNLMI